MDEEIESLLIAVRADTRGFDHDLVEIKKKIDYGLGKDAERAARAFGRTLNQVLSDGKIGFDELKSIALNAMEQIAEAAIRNGIGAAMGGSGGSAGGAFAGLIGAILGLPGRATGGPVSPGAAYLVGERGPEMFVPTASGTVAPLRAGGGRDVRVSIAIQTPPGGEPRMLARSSRQIAQAVARAIDASGD
jgi:phage-related minor tail protein